MTRWEYKIVAPGFRAALDDSKMENKLNELGADGWELVGFKGDYYVFKRPA